MPNLKLHVAVVFTPVSGRVEGDLACFVNRDKAVAIREALRAKRLWEIKGVKTYRILVGTLREEATLPLNFKLVPLTYKHRAVKP